MNGRKRLDRIVGAASTPVKDANKRAIRRKNIDEFVDCVSNAVSRGGGADDRSLDGGADAP
jgi:hypothetical protein